MVRPAPLGPGPPVTAGVPHPWNRGFSWVRPKRDELLVLSAAQSDQYHEQGFTLVEDAFDPGELAEVTSALDDIEAGVEALLRTRPDGRMFIADADSIVFAPHAVAVSDAARRFASHAVFAGICRDLLGDDVRLYWDQLVYKKPERPRPFPWHQDNGYTYIEPQQYLTCWVPLSDATVENGCPWVVPGLHLGGTLRHEYVDPLGFRCLTDPEGAVPVPAQVGSVVVFSSLTPHLTGPNETDEVRRTYILQYAPDGVEALRGEPDAGPPTSRDAQDDPVRQFPVVVGGVPVTAAGP